jgi:hypothetical protein
MAAWLTIYCARAVDQVKAEDLEAVLEKADLFTLAERFGIEDEEVVSRAQDLVRIESVSDLGEVKFRLSYQPPRFRPVNVWVWTEPGFVRQLGEEAKEGLAGSRRKGVGRVRTHLDRVVQVAALELGWSQLEDMGVVLSGQVAEYLAGVGDGLICDQNDDWWAVKKGRPVLLVGPKRRG